MNITILIRAIELDSGRFIRATVMEGDRKYDYAVIEDLGIESLLDAIKPAVIKWWNEKDLPGTRAELKQENQK